MHSYQLEYKMKQGSSYNSSKGAKVHQKVNSPDSFLQSSEMYLQRYQTKDSCKRKVSQIGKVVDTHLRRNFDGQRRNHIDSHQNLRKSIQRDRSVNLDHWRKQAFKYQQKVFSLEQEVSKLKLQNHTLKTQVKTLKQNKTRNKDNISHLSHTKASQAMQLTKLLNQQAQTISKVKVQLEIKCSKIKDLEYQLKTLRQKHEDDEICNAQMSLDSIPNFKDFRKQALKSHNKRNKVSQPLRDEQLLDILQKLGKNIEEIQFKVEKDSSVSPSINSQTT